MFICRVKIEMLRVTCSSSDADSLKIGSLQNHLVWSIILHIFIINGNSIKSKGTYFCKHLRRKSFAPAERWSGIGGWDLVVPIWKRAATWKPVILVNINIQRAPQQNLRSQNVSYLLLVLLAPRRLSCGHLNYSTAHAPYVSRAEKEASAYENININ